MIHIRNLPGCQLLLHDQELFREVTSYLLYCRHKSMEDEDDNLNFSVMSADDLPISERPCPPEEIVKINIKADGQSITMYRIAYPTEVLFIPAINFLSDFTSTTQKSALSFPFKTGNRSRQTICLTGIFQSFEKS